MGRWLALSLSASNGRGKAEVQAMRSRVAPMSSPVYWALLGLVIERSSYAYELAVRFERTYDGLLTLSSPSHVYTGLGALQSRQMIEQIPGQSNGRQPKPHYRATAKGCEEYRDWFASQISEDFRRQRLFTMQLAALARTPGYALEVLGRCEQACQTEVERTPQTDGEHAIPDLKSRLTAHLIREEHRLALEAKLTWIRFAREQINELAPHPGDVPAHTQ
jgi:DNA-binding PadR family transcriptional regulator